MCKDFSGLGLLISSLSILWPENTLCKYSFYVLKCIGIYFTFQNMVSGNKDSVCGGKEGRGMNCLPWAYWIKFKIIHTIFIFF